MKFMNKNKKGFTLVELMIVVVIMAILVAVAVPIFNSVTKNAKTKSCNANARTLSGQINAVIMNKIGGTDDEKKVNTILLGPDVNVDLLFNSDPAGTDKFINYVQGDKFPVCPFNAPGETTYQYYTATDGKVFCGTTATAPSDHDITYVEPTEAP